MSAVSTPRPGDRVGRYRLLEPLGEGGMGVVFRAHDPKLDRRVALKLIGPSPRRGPDGPERLIREARSLAKLSHPNIVEVFDVGTWEGNVFIAMEEVDGVTLDIWARAREPKETLPVLILAGRGLAAAHRSGIVHRDFKPANVLVDPQGKRPRVLDFGLARGPGTSSAVPSDDNPTEVVDSLDEQLTAPGLVMGTPAYMAPEQHIGADVDARADQYAFCVAAWEALFGMRPFAGHSLEELTEQKFAAAIQAPGKRGVPGRVEAALRRGLQPKPERRFASMDALLAALAPRRRAGRWIAGGLAVVLAGGVAAAVWSPGHDPCGSATRKVERIWNGARADAVDAAMGATGLPYAASTASRVRARLDAYAEEAGQLREEACRAAGIEAEGSIEDAELDRRIACIDRRLVELETLAGVLERATPDDVSRAVTLASRLGDLQRCATPEDLESRWPEPTDTGQAIAAAEVRRLTARVDTLLAAGRFEAARTQALAAEDMAARTGFAATTAEVALRLGRLDEAQGHYEEAARRYEEAAHVAAGGGYDRLALMAKNGLVAVYGYRLARFDEAERWGKDAQTHLERLRDPGMEEALLLNNLGQAAMASGRYDDARRYHERSLALREERLDADDPDVGTALLNLGNVLHSMDDNAGAQRVYRRVVPIWERALGPDHPDMAGLHNNLGTVALRLGQTDEARTHLERALSIWEGVHGKDHPAVGIALVNLAELDSSADKYRRAIEIFEANLGPDHPNVAIAANNLGRLLAAQEDYDEAAALFRRAASILTTTLGENHPDVADPLVGLGESLLAQHKPALEPLQRAVDLIAARGGVDLATARWGLARALEASGDRRTAEAQARQARQDAADTDAATELKEAIDTWLADKPAPTR